MLKSFWDIMFEHVPVHGLIISRGHACYSAHTVHTLLCNQRSFFFFSRSQAIGKNGDIFMSLCSFISQLPINPKVCCSACCKQASLEGGRDAIVPSQHLLKDSATFRSYSLMSYCKLAQYAPTDISLYL